MLPQPTLILLTHAPYHPLTQLGFDFAQGFCEQFKQNTAADMTPLPLKVFIYSDGAYLANRLAWQPADKINPTIAWQQLAEKYQIELQVCVSVALARGITDSDNATRHGLDGENLAQGFSLVGLGELAMALHSGYRLVQF